MRRSASKNPDSCSGYGASGQPPLASGEKNTKSYTFTG
jgi:hypothetical protein